MPVKPTEPGRDRVALHVCWGSTVILALCYGVFAGMFQLFPYGLFADAVVGYRHLHPGEGTTSTNWYFKTVTKHPPPIAHTDRAHLGVNLVTEIHRDELSVKVMDLDGQMIHRWAIDWFAIWPDASHVPDHLVPRSRPGTHVNGAALLAGGDLVFNFEHLGLVRLDRSGKVVWRLAYQTHHSVVLGDDGNLWVCGQKEHTEPMSDFPMLVPPFVEDTVLVVTPDGRVIKEWSIPGVLRANGRTGLLCLANRDTFSTAVSGDVTHLNHVEPFPTRLRAAFFGPGDVLVSLRNVNTVLVFDSRSGAIEFLSTGLFVRQHDPHFVDGDTISVLDNNTAGDTGERLQSRIALVAAPSQTVTTYFAGTRETPFFTPILGRHQWLPNGNLLITDSCAGRAFELDRHLQVVWWYVNYIGEDTVGAIEQVERLPAEVASLFR